jgi:S1-C subfamily serine protease
MVPLDPALKDGACGARTGQGETHMKKYLLGLSCCIVAIASIFHSTLPIEALAAPPAPAEQFSGGSFSFDEAQADSIWRGSKTLDKQSAKGTAVVTTDQPDSGHDLERPAHEEIREPTGELKGKHLQDLLVGASTGTAWPISSGYVVTNSHIISEGSKVILISAQGQEIPAWIVLRDKANDIVVLEVKDPHALPPALPLAQSQARLGASVFTLGFPRVDFMGRTPKLSAGVISGENGLRDDPESFQTTVPIQPGNSGGPLLNMKGEVIGVVRAMIGIRNEANGNLQVLQNTSCALKIKGIQELLPLLPQKDSRIYVLPNLSDDLETLASRIKDSVLLVISR